jgi:hypothetical protein
MAVTRRPYAMRFAKNGAMLLLYRGDAKRSTRWDQQAPWSAASRRRYSWRVHVGGKL